MGGRYTELEETGDNAREAVQTVSAMISNRQEEYELLEPQVLVISVLLSVLLEALVLNEDVIGPMRDGVKSTFSVDTTKDIRKHHERASLLVLKLLRSVPLLPHPLLIEEEFVVLVTNGDGREGPRSIESRAIRVASAQSVRTRKSNDFLVIEA